ncbi:S-adenosyl-L-methionine-dependent methyltransferase [Ascobolus immersus RN42]|uniref:S-adenosyl-L-methionine-dependent methyltransferase n=1 Tax=Ascobolus immersus RN42 TaxID=1160509 RepID=A0A3N4ITJ6_ASCIM|nr:S-adenosyl-L-methionine-dependent methyltransferase [Ascobolus immersus RN42]
MATFSSSTFNAARYASCRPQVPTALPSFLLSHLPGPHKTLIDIGCGPGLSTIPFIPHFENITGVDPSEVMVGHANQRIAPTESNQNPYPGKNVSFKVGNAEDFKPLGVPDNSVDMVISGEAAHWFDQSRFWPEMNRILRPGGIVGIWGYIDGLITGAPTASERMQYWSYDDAQLGPYWESGRNELRNWYGNIKAPLEDKAWARRKYWLHKAKLMGPEPPAREGEEEVATGPLFQRTMKLNDLENLFRTWSSVHNWRKKFKEAVRKTEGGKGDIVDIMMEDMVREEPNWEYTEEEIKSCAWADRDIEFTWDSVVLIVQKAEN